MAWNDDDGETPSEAWGYRDDTPNIPPNASPAMTGRESDMVTGEGSKVIDDDEAYAHWRRLTGHYQRELDIQSAWRAQMALDEAFYDGDQISDADRIEMEARGQLPITYNVIAPSVDWLLGNERRHRTDPKILARTKQGTKSAQRKSQLMKYVYDQSQGEMEITLAHRDQVRVGLGWLESGLQGETENEPVFMAYEKWRNILHDSRAEKMDFSDARYMFRTRWSDLDIAASIFKGPQQLAILYGSSIDGAGYMPEWDDLGDDYMDEQERNATLSSAGPRETRDARRRRVRLIEAWFRMPVETEVIFGGEWNGAIYMPGHPGQEKTLMQGAEIGSRVKMRTHVAIMASRGMLHMQESPYLHNRFPFTPLIGNQKAGTHEPYGLIRNLRDIQTDVNRRAAKALHIVSTNKVIMDDDAVEDVDELADELARPDAILRVKKGARFDINADRELAPAHMELFSRGIMMIQQISGITDENMGRETNATSGRAIIARQDQGTTTTWHFTDNLRYALRCHGEKMLALVEQYYTDQKEFRITNQRGVPDFVAANDGMPENAIALTRADFVVSEDQWQATQKKTQMAEVMEILAQLAPVAPQLVMVLLDLIFDMTDLPSKDEIVSRIRDITGMEDPDVDPDAADPEVLARRQAKQMAAAMEQRAAEAKIAAEEADAQHKQAQAFKTHAEGLKSAHSLTEQELATVAKAFETALQLMSARPAAPVADTLLTNAESTTQQAMSIAAKRSAPGGVGAPQPPQQPQAMPPQEGVPPQPAM